MSTPSLVFLAEEYVQSRLLDNTSGFNALIEQTATTYAVQPFTLSIQSAPPSLYLGRYTPEDIQKSVGGASSMNFPLAILSIVNANSIGKQAMRVTPSTFSGSVPMSLDFYVAYPMSSLPPDGNAMFCAVMDAVTGALCGPGAMGTVPAGLAFNNEVLVEQGNMSWDGSRWIQAIPCAINFNVIG